MYRYFVELLLIQEFSREAPELEIRLFPFLCQGFDSISSSEKMEAETAIHLEDAWLSIGMEITKPLHQKSLEIHPFTSIHLEDGLGNPEKNHSPPKLFFFAIRNHLVWKKTFHYPRFKWEEFELSKQFITPFWL